MILIRYTPKFIRMYSGLELALQEEVKERIYLFRTEKNHKILKLHKLNGKLKGRYAFSINYKIRVIFNYTNKKVVNLLYIGDHDGLYR